MKFERTVKLDNIDPDSSAIEAEAVNQMLGKSLPPALDTGIGAVDFEHGQLLSCMASLRQLCVDPTRDTCLPCSGEQRAHCESSLIGILGDLLAFILDHFHTEEKAMRDSLLYMLDREVCEAHMEDHARISEKIQQIVAAIEPDKTVLQVRELSALLERWMTHHVDLHDKALARWIARQESFTDLFKKT
ncbi:MAG: hemerythrin family protein [Rhodocyclaceae bacterium]|nr:hemerythrin family protein [Rhodocyclaceae bacterium]